MIQLFNEEELKSAKTLDKLPCECIFCKNKFYITKREIMRNIRNKRNSGKYCSQKCKSLNEITKQEMKCAYCSRNVLKIPANIKKSKSGNVFCSRSCATTYNNQHKTTGTRRSKLEVWLEEQLLTIYPDQKILFNDKTTINSELDIYFSNLKLAFELNGIFHYEPIYGQDKFDKIQNNDNRKFQACIEHRIELCIVDSSSFKNFKENKAKTYLDIITNVINQKIFNMSKN